MPDVFSESSNDEDQKNALAVLLKELKEFDESKVKAKSVEDISSKESDTEEKVLLVFISFFENNKYFVPLDQKFCQRC